MDIEGIIVGFVTLMVLAVLTISLVLPTTVAGIEGSNQAGTVSNEVFTGVAAVPSTLAKYVAEVTSFEKGTAATASNLVSFKGNATKTVTLVKPYTGANRTITVKSDFDTTLDNVTFTFNGNYIGKLSSNTETWTGLGSTLLDGTNTFVFTNNNGTTTNITNITVSYTSFVANTAYTLSEGAITPAANGTYRAGYYYATAQTNNTQTLLGVIPLVIAVLLVLVVLGFWKMFGG